jgi:hypothetical protein
VRAIGAAAVLAIALAGLFAAGACLPDLTAIAAADGALEAAAAPFEGCGDGVIATLDDGGDAGESCDPGFEGDAQVPGCRACQITCEGTLDPKSGHCYFAAGADVSYPLALARCKAERAHVVTFASDEELTFVKNIAASGYWVGLSIKSAELFGAYGPPAERLEEPGFPFPSAPSPAAAGPCEGCFGSGADGGLFPSADVDASDTTTDTSCIASRGGDGWFRVPCNADIARPTICEREPAGMRSKICGNEGLCLNVARTAGVKTYLVTVSAADPETAATTCSFLDGGSLVVFDSREEREQIAHEIVKRNPDDEQQLWIGLHADAGAWTWDDGVSAASPARPPPWGNAQPNGATNARAFIRVNAPAYDTQLAYADDGGRAPRLFICQQPVR